MVIYMQYCLLVLGILVCCLGFCCATVHCFFGNHNTVAFMDCVEYSVLILGVLLCCFASAALLYIVFDYEFTRIFALISQYNNKTM